MWLQGALAAITAGSGRRHRQPLLVVRSARAVSAPGSHDSRAGEAALARLMSFDWRAALIAVVAALLVFRSQAGMLTVLGVSALLGLGLSLASLRPFLPAPARCWAGPCA